MKSANRWRSASLENPRWPLWGSFALLIASAICVASLAAQTSGNSAGTEASAATAASPAPIRTPNYALEARFLPANMSKLVFDLSVTPHWFALSDKFWYSYRTSEGTNYYIVDPLKKSKSLLWDNAKIAASLSLLTNFPYDSQHLPIKRLKLVDKDTRMRFEVEIRKDGVVPNEPEKKIQNDGSQQGNESEVKQGEVTQNEDKQTEQQGRPTAPREETRTLVFEYDLATGKVTRQDNAEPMKPRPLWASVSPDEKTVVFARGQNLYMMDGENYAKALKKPGDAGIIESQLTTGGVEKFSYARRLLPEQEDALKKEDKGDTNKAGIRAPAIQIHWSQDSKKFAVVRRDERKIPDFWVIHSLANPRPILESYPYPLPGEAAMPIDQVEILDVASKQLVVVQQGDGRHLRGIDTAVAVNLTWISGAVRVRGPGSDIQVLADQATADQRPAVRIGERRRSLPGDLREVVVQAHVPGGVVVLQQFALRDQRLVEVRRWRVRPEGAREALVLQIDDQDVIDRS